MTFYIVETMKRDSRPFVFVIHLIFKRLDFCVGAGEVPTEVMIGGALPDVFLAGASLLSRGTRSASSSCFFARRVITSMHDKIRVLRVLRYVFPHRRTNNVYLEVVLARPVESILR